jgi:flagellar basal body rod protein FlgC
LELAFGQGLIRAAAGLIATFQSVAAVVLSVAGAYFRLNAAIDGFFGNEERAAAATANANAAFGAATELAYKADSNFKLLKNTTEQLAMATAQNTVATQETVEVEKTNEAQIKKTNEALLKYMDVLSKTGEEQLKFAQADFAEAMKAEGATIAELRTGLEAYMHILDETYRIRIAGEEAIAAKMKESGGDPVQQMEAQLAILETEKAHIEARLAGWQTYYTSLSALHATATEQMKVKTNELANLEKSAAAQRRSYAEQMVALQIQLYQAQGKAATDLEIRELKLIELAKQRREANQLTGEAQIEALKAVQKGYGELTEQVTVEGKKWDGTTRTYVKTLEVVKTSEDSIKTAMDNVNSVQRDINNATDAATIAKKEEIKALDEYKTSVAAAMGEAKSQMEAYQREILDISEAIGKIERDIAIEIHINSKIFCEIKELNSMLDNATRARTVKIKIESSSSGGGAGGTEDPSGYTPDNWESDEGGYSPGDWGSDEAGPGFVSSYDSYAKGLDYVPRDNFHANLHEGETVLTKKEAEAYRKGKGGTVNFNPTINIVGANKSPEQLAREISKPLYAEWQRLSVVN